MANFYSTLARDIFANEFESDTGIITHSQISGWLSANIGGLNGLINTNFSGDDPTVDNAAASIFYDMYMRNYYDRSSRNALRGVLQSSSNGDNILSVSDGDNRIQFLNKNEVAKTYRNMSKSLDESIKEKSYKYTMYAAEPLQVGGWEASISGFNYPYYRPY